MPVNRQQIEDACIAYQMAHRSQGATKATWEDLSEHVRRAQRTAMAAALAVVYEPRSPLSNGTEAFYVGQPVIVGDMLTGEGLGVVSSYTGDEVVVRALGGGLVTTKPRSVRPVQRAVVKLNQFGVGRVLHGHEGMTFTVDRFTGGCVVPGDGPRPAQTIGLTAHVRDYRYPGDHFPYQIWSLAERDYEILKEER